MIDQHDTHTGAILVGGKSSRMGQPKHLLRLPDGRRMIDSIQETLCQVCRKVVVVGTADGIGGFTQVRDLRYDVGPLGGIEALLASGFDTQYLICPCDLPLISADLIRQLTRQSESLATVFHIQDHESLDPLPARLSGEALPVVRKLIDQGERAVWRLMEELSVEVIELSRDEARQLHNVNTPSFYLAVR